MGTAQPRLQYTLAEYLEFEQGRAQKCEYWRGQIYAMAGAGPAHKQICFNLAGVSARQLQGGGCRGYSSDQKIWIEAAELNTYADLTIVCGEPPLSRPAPDAAAEPTSDHRSALAEYGGL
jgi:Uma2 family endonuclease